jgi:hypothetical protein
MLKATVQGLQSLRRPEEVAKARGKTIAEVLPVPKIKPEEAEPEPVAVAAEPEAEAEAEAAPPEESQDG